MVEKFNVEYAMKYGFTAQGSQNNKLSINKSFKNPFLYQLIIYIIIILSIIGIVDMLRRIFYFFKYSISRTTMLPKNS